ncbi:MAG TPA: enoyl-CoA hydratase/isomerase family protein [Chloroflexota bacterium]|jgi:enoyl-CoA hydratase/carnithine racemase|nr:enoyl-CoA hydratase/isomerase family protein [Chloroflexota bacterium]
MAADGTVHVARNGAWWTVTLDNPAEENALSAAMFDALADILAEASRTPDCAVLLLEGAHGTFSRGRDRAGYARQRALGPLGLRAEFERITRVNDLLVAAAPVTLAAVRGVAFGAACGLVARCDLALAAHDARFGFPEMRAGIPPTLVLAYVAKAFPHKRLFERILTGAEFDAAEALALGLVTRVVTTDVEQEARALAATIAASDPLHVRTCKQFWREVQDMSYGAAARYGAHVLAVVLGERAEDRASPAGH